MATRNLFQSSIFRKQVVAATGLLMVLFVILHLAGNLLIYFGPEVFNGYSEKLHAIPELLWVARIILIAAFFIHVWFTVLLVMENSEARYQQYAVTASKQTDKSFARKYMFYTGALTFFVLFVHLYHFTFQSHDGPKTELGGAGELGLYGLVWNTFSNFGVVILYIAFVGGVGLHLNHGIQSMFQTVGINHERYMPMIVKASRAIGIIVAAGFATIPIYVLLRGTPSL